MESYRWFLLLSAVFWVAFVGVWTWWIGRRLRRRRRLREWPRTTAVLTEARASRESVTMDYQTTRDVVFHGRWEAVDPRGHTRRGTVQTSRRRLDVGDHLELAYDPEDPTAHEVVEVMSPAWAVAAILVLATSGLVLGGHHVLPRPRPRLTHHCPPAAPSARPLRCTARCSGRPARRRAAARRAPAAGRACRWLGHRGVVVGVVEVSGPGGVLLPVPGCVLGPETYALRGARRPDGMGSRKG